MSGGYRGAVVMEVGLGLGWERAWEKRVDEGLGEGAPCGLGFSSALELTDDEWGRG